MNSDYFVYKDKNTLYDTDVIKQIYEHLEDENSKDRWINRLLYSLTLDYKNIGRVVLTTKGGLRLRNTIVESEKDFLVYGAGKRGKQLVELFPEAKWAGFIDQFSSGNYMGIPIYQQYTDSMKSLSVVISNSVGFLDIKKHLIKTGFDEKRIICLEEINKEMSKKQYFDSDIISLDLIQGGFVDGGMYDGNDIIRYSAWNDKYSAWKIWGVEPNKQLFDDCNKRISRLFDNVELYCNAFSNKKEQVYISKQDQASFLDDTCGDEAVDTITIDDICCGYKTGYIKLDVEGFEEKALQGAERIIKTQHPVIAVCIYHKKNDVYRIPKLLLDYYPGYKFKIGHYSIAQVDTVLYAY